MVTDNLSFLLAIFYLLEGQIKTKKIKGCDFGGFQSPREHYESPCRTSMGGQT
jgi:hypothetical protein